MANEELIIIQRTQQELMVALSVHYQATKNLQQRVDRLENMSLDIYKRIDNLTDLIKKIKGDLACKDNVNTAKQ